MKYPRRDVGKCWHWKQLSAPGCWIRYIPVPVETAAKYTQLRNKQILCVVQSQELEGTSVWRHMFGYLTTAVNKWAKLRALHAFLPHVLTCPTYVHTCLCFLSAFLFLLALPAFTFWCALHAHFSFIFLRALHVFLFLRVICTFIYLCALPFFLFLRALCGFIFHVHANKIHTNW